MEAAKKAAAAEKQSRIQMVLSAAEAKKATEAVKAHAAASTLGARTSTLLAKGLAKAKVAAASLYAALGPVGRTYCPA